jgi:hypothetical protein
MVAKMFEYLWMMMAPARDTRNTKYTSKLNLLSLFAAVNKDIYISKEMIIRVAKQDAKVKVNDVRE